MRTLFLIGLFSITLLSFSQRRTGMVQDNYSGTISTHFNPANLADSRFKFHMNVVGFNAAAQNNFLQLETPHSAYEFVHWSWDSMFMTEDTNFTFQEYYVKERLNGNDYFAYTNATVDYLHMQIGLDDRSGIGIKFSTRAVGSITNIPEDVVKTFLQDLDTLGRTKENQYRLLDRNMNASKSGAAGMVYNQIGIKYAAVINERKSNFWKLGVGLDYNTALFGAYARFNDVSYQLTGIDTIDIATSDMELAYVNTSYYRDPTRRLSDFFGSTRLGRGVGINAGFVYEHRTNPKAHKYKMNRKKYEDREVNKYDWKLGASIVDLGFVGFNKPGETRFVKTVNQSANINWNDFDAADNWGDIDEPDTLLNTLFVDTDTASKFTMYTPATLNLLYDLKLAEGFYLGGTYQQSLIGTRGKGVKGPSVLAVTPRYESRWFSASLPISASRYYNKINFGAYVRAGVFYIGSDNLGGIMGGTKTNGYNLYAGFTLPIHYNRHLDDDNDQVSNDVDECPDFAGPYKTKGCPDADGDKVRDDEDKCPNDAGPKSTAGCPDNDEDGLVGDDDLCPETYGDKNSAGCPDTDGDGIHDGIDKCINEAGEKLLDGCPEVIVVDEPVIPDTIPIHTDPPPTKGPVVFSKFDDWDFANYDYWPVLGAYNDIRWAQELQDRVLRNTGLTTSMQSIPGVSKIYITLGKATNLEQAKAIQNTLDLPRINQELNGKVWWKKVKK